MHAEQLSNIGGTQLAARFGALSCDHLEYATQADAEALAASGTVAVLLPVAFYSLAADRKPPVQELRRAGAADFVVWDVNSLDELGYWVGFNRCRTVVKAAEVVNGQTLSAMPFARSRQRRGVT
jgi:imidazolonepropionase-like amidohydrolase